MTGISDTDIGTRDRILRLIIEQGPITSAELDRLILRLARDLHITFVIVSHELASIFAIADRVIMLDKKTKGIVAEGRPQELRDRSDNPWVQQFFNRTVEPRSGA